MPTGVELVAEDALQLEQQQQMVMQQTQRGQQGVTAVGVTMVVVTAVLLQVPASLAAPGVTGHRRHLQIA